jgi:D-xylonolactonase
MHEPSNLVKLRIVADYHTECGESPLWDRRTSTLFWTDCVGNRFFQYSPLTGKHRQVKSGLQINRCLVASDGFVITNNDGLWRWDGQDSLVLIANRVDAIPLQLNDAVADARGRVFAGTCFYNPNASYPLGHLVRIDNDGKAAVLDDGIHLANGLAFSPDGRILYFADSVARRIYAYDFEIGAGSVSNRRVLAYVPETQGLPDGLAVDAAGNIWCAQWFGGAVVCYNPRGMVCGKIDIPARQVSSVAFGGVDCSELFITTAAKPEPMPVMPPGYDPYNGTNGGALFSFLSSARGVLLHAAKL